MVFRENIRWVTSFLLPLMYMTSLAQGPIVADNFEGYVTGARLCTQAPAYWFTWNNGTGTAEDPKVTDSLAFQGNNSLLITGTNDVLLDLNGKTSGRFEVGFYVRIPQGKVGYYSILQQFAGNNSKLGLRCYFDAANKAKIVAAGDQAEFNFYHNQWIQVRNIIDLDNDYLEIYINGKLKLEGTWSVGVPGMPGLRNLDAVNFYAWNADQRQPAMYVDSVVYSEIPAPDPPRNLTATVNGNDISLAWHPPATGIPSGYMVYRDSVIITPLLTGLNYLDSGVYPGEYRYSVKAVYGSGMSQPTAPVTAVVEGGTKRNFVLLEIATGTWCTYCPGASMGADDLVTNGEDVAVIEYHNKDEYSNSDSDLRNSFYSVPGFPTAHFDGLEEIAYGNSTKSMYPVYMPVYGQRIPKRSLFSVGVDVKQTGARELQVTVAARKIYPYEGSDLRLQLVLTESHIPETWQTIMNEVNFVCRKMYPDYQGTMMDFAADTMVMVNYNLLLDSTYVFGNCELVAFLQDNTTREVLQTDKFSLKSLGTKDLQGVSLSVHPNPVSDLLLVKCGLPVRSIRIMDYAGRTKMEFFPKNSAIQLDVSSLDPGLYFLQVQTEQGGSVRKVMVYGGGRTK